MKISAREVALTATFAALSWIVSKFIPGIPIIGAEGSKISWDVSLAPIYGVIIGPYLGFLAALIGGLVAAGSLFTVLTSFCTGVSAFVAGMLTDKERKSYGWALSAAVIALLLAGWYSTEVGRTAPFYPVLHIAGLLIALFARGWISERLAEGKPEGKNAIPREFNVRPLALGIVLVFAGSVVYTRHAAFLKFMGATEFASGTLSFTAYALLIVGILSAVYSFFNWIKPGFVTAVALACYCGIIADHMLGNLIFLGMIDAVAPALKEAPSEVIAGIFMGVLPISVVERVLFTAIATVIAVALLPTLRKVGIIYRK
ncbi:MAG: ECF transporter S component [Nitrososphaerota archaeon]|nr:ECF transporter S component [Candidatus Bathyarchaeota archaeon]MDW8024075.1 ECF transporter S component [Nitrososphaerota archaeon]